MTSAENLHPGKLILALMDARGWGLTRLSWALNLPVPEVAALAGGETRIDLHMVRRLGWAFDTGRELWLDRQKHYDDKKEGKS